MTRALPSSLAAILALAAPFAHAHPGHGLLGPHWHATDTLGLLLVGLVASGAAWWFLRGK
ncbi:MAG TPA: hypothetical protein VGF26_05080 [Ramlibacter sp.]